MTSIEQRVQRAAALAQERLGARLRALLLFGSCLSPRTARPGSIPDLLAVVDDLDGALVGLGEGGLTRLVARVLPPLTLNLREATRGPSVAKLNLIDPAALRGALESLADLYLAGRLSKRTDLLYARDAACAAELAVLTDRAARTMARLALAGLERRPVLDDVVRRAIALSYASEPRPERRDRIEAVFEAFAPWYLERFRPLVAERGLLVDDRVAPVRRAEARVLAERLRRSRLRTVARWPKQMLVYRGWLAYLVAKLRRAR